MDGWRDGHLLARVREPAHEGKANRALIELLAGWLGVAKSRITLVSGQTSKLKRIRVEE